MNGSFRDDENGSNQQDRHRIVHEAPTVESVSDRQLTGPHGEGCADVDLDAEMDSLMMILGSMLMGKARCVSITVTEG